MKLEAKLSPTTLSVQSERLIGQANIDVIEDIFVLKDCQYVFAAESHIEGRYRGSSRPFGQSDGERWLLG